MMRFWISAAVLSLTIFGCSAESNEGNNSTNNDGSACVTCGPAVMCGEACLDACGCCCDSGEERVRGDELQRCTLEGCWEVVGPAPADVGSDTGDGTDMGPRSDMNVGSDADTDMQQPDVGPTECTESPNGGSAPTNTCSHGAADWIAWKWTAPRDMELQTIEMHTDEGFGAFFADGMGGPGTVLFEGPLSMADADGWRELTAPAPVAVTQGTTYWIGENVMTCSTAEDGTEWDYYTSDATTGPWNGPFNAHPFTARLVGTCM